MAVIPLRKAVLSAAETLMENLTSAHTHHHKTLEDLEMGRSAKYERTPDRCPGQGMV
ncbi:MAG: hypothetical protein ABJL55_16445 [Roseibium sp.]